MENELGSLRITQKQRQVSGNIAVMAGFTSMGLTILIISVCCGTTYVYLRLRTGRTFIQMVRYYADKKARKRQAPGAQPLTEAASMIIEQQQH